MSPRSSTSMSLCACLLIYFTDGYGEREIPRPKTYRNLWVVLGDEENLSLKEPYGTVISF